MRSIIYCLSHAVILLLCEILLTDRFIYGVLAGLLPLVLFMVIDSLIIERKINRQKSLNKLLEDLPESAEYKDVAREVE